MPDAEMKWCHWFEDEMEEDYLDARHAQAYSHLRRLLKKNERLREALEEREGKISGLQKQLEEISTLMSDIY